jgi:hypothetical protein
MLIEETPTRWSKEDMCQSSAFKMEAKAAFFVTNIVISLTAKNR